MACGQRYPGHKPSNPMLFAHSDPLTSWLSMNGQACDIWHGHQVASWDYSPDHLSPSPDTMLHSSRGLISDNIVMCNELYLFCFFWGSCRIDFLDQFRPFSVSLQPLQSHFSREVIWEDDILVSVDTTYREIVSKISFIASNSAHNWLLDLEHTRQHVQKFLGSVNKYLISQNIYMSIIYVRIYFPLKIRLLWKLETRSVHISDYWGQVNYATRGSYEVWDVSRDTRDTATPGDTPCHGSRHAARDTFLTVTILSPKSDDDSRFSPPLFLYLWTSAVTFIKLQ